MTTQFEIETQARLHALEFLTTNLYNVALKASGATEDQVIQAEADIWATAEASSVRGASPEVSDVLTNETARRIAYLFGIAREARRTEGSPG